MITYDYYRIFYYVAQYKSFTKAAAALGNNQPNITRCMNNLEAELDCKLFLRSNKGVLLTPEGHKLYEHVAIAFEQLALGEEAIIRNRDLENGLISIGASENALRLILLSELEHFCARYPHVRIRLLNYSAPQAVKALENNIIDFAIVSTPVLVHKHMHQEKLVSYDEILLGGTKYKQFAQQVHYLEDISEMPLIGLCEGSSTHTHYSRFFMEHDLPFEPDMEAAKSQMEEAEKVRLQTQTKLELYKEQYKADKEAYDILSPQMEKRGKIIEKHTKLETLYKLLSGNMSGNRMDLETYVQRYYLEKILYAANRRFANMSAGQFELRMVDEENAGKGKNRGLDLMVYSNVTGKEREVRTLSGGESFMAALALALGMADQIQESSAAIHLDVMFVDEGFGSLDEHSREQAVKVLQELAGGSKLIGIISHVTELKQEIEDQLIVSKDEKGSHVKWQIS